MLTHALQKTTNFFMYSRNIKTILYVLLGIFFVLLLSDILYTETSVLSAYAKGCILVLLFVVLVWYLYKKDTETLEAIKENIVATMPLFSKESNISDKDVQVVTEEIIEVVEEDVYIEPIVPESPEQEIQETNIKVAESKEALAQDEPEVFSYLEKFRETLVGHKCERRSAGQQDFFQTEEGEYAEGDVFLGVKISDILKLSEEYAPLLGESEIQQLLASHVHDERIAAVWLLINRYKIGDKEEKQGIYDFYLENRGLINNWDLVDLAARNIVGNHLLHEQSNHEILQTLMKSESVWDKRSAVMSTHPFVLSGNVSHAFGVIGALADNREELLQSSLGWVLKESYKHAPEATEEFIKDNFNKFSKQAVRIGTERMEKDYRKAFLRGEF